MRGKGKEEATPKKNIRTSKKTVYRTISKSSCHINSLFLILKLSTTILDGETQVKYSFQVIVLHKNSTLYKH